MLTTARKQIVEKVVANADGVLFRVWFVVSNENGKVVAKPFRAVQIGNVSESEIKIALPCAKTKNVCNFQPVKTFTEKIISPYTSLLFVSGSKPRAPTLF